MAVKTFKPTSAGIRFRTVLKNEEITTSTPEKSLLITLNKNAGRNNYGRVTARHKGGGNKLKYRVIDFKRDKFNIPAKVASIEYDPNRSANIALLDYRDGEKRYIIAPLNLAVGDIVESGDNVDIRIGNSLPLKNIPIGTVVHNIEVTPLKGAQMARSAGSFCQLSGKEGNYAILRLPSGELRKINLKCMATVGQVGNLDYELISLGKAGRSRWLGIRPSVRGVAMNPIDHPLGGGEGRSSGGRHPCSPWGWITKGRKTRKNKVTDKYIIKRRK